MTIRLIEEVVQVKEILVMIAFTALRTAVTTKLTATTNCYPSQFYLKNKNY